MNYEVSRRKLIYIFAIPDDTHKGLLKIGETTIKNVQPTEYNLRQAATERIRQYTNTAAIPFKLLHVELAVRDDGRAFRDYHVHHLLKKYRAKVEGSTGREWFKVNLDTAINAIRSVKQRKKSVKTSAAYDEIIFRPEQDAAISKTVNYFKHGDKFLWNAKMRFGKTLCALEVVRQMKFKKTIIITHRPAVKQGWFEDFDKIFSGTDYLCLNKDDTIKGVKKNFVYFASIQYLRDSKAVNDKSTNNKKGDIFGEKWDLVIVDEAHEGTKTILGDKVIKALVKKKTKLLALSGTPFNLLDEYEADSVYTWDYVMEQQAKADWDATHFGDSNPYDELPKMNILTYNLGDLLGKSFAGDDDIVFSFKEFFKVDGERFVHEPDIRRFLDLLVKPDANNYPYSRADFRNMFRHTLWIIPGVKEAKALSQLLQRHKVFKSFKIVNAAGDGDDGKIEDIEIVHDAIRDNDYTITLSCGRFTTGVTVPEWSAVFMLAGGYSTSAASYLQTIFRVQSPCNISGVSKRNCYVFDFAPDRTLKVIVDAVKASSRAGKTTNSDRQHLDALLKFCPVIAIEGSKMKTLDANKLLQRVKNAQAERIARNGFDDTNLYNDTLRDLTDIDWKKFDDLKKIIGASKTAKTGDIVVNDQGLTGDDTTGKSDKTKRPRTDEEKENARKAAVKRNAISILRGISIRMPLLIYGADIDFDADFTVDMFLDPKIIDDASWEEFMPTGVTRAKFKDFIKYYDPENFINAGRIVRQRAKDADNLTPSERIKEIAALFATFKNPDKETVLTPWDVVKLHIDSVFDEKFFTANKHILDINAKTGLYPLYVAYKIYRTRFGNVDESKTPLAARQRWDKTVAENIFVICKTPMAVTITKRTLMGYRAGSVNAQHFKDLIPTLKLTPSRFIDRITDKSFWSKGVGKMFFDGVVGNPPYQVAGSGTSNFAASIYHEFIKITYNDKLTKRASLIHPARCLFNAGSATGDFNEKFLNNEHVRVVCYESDSKKFFPTSDIKGGVAITEYDATKTFGVIGTFIPFDELIGIYQKAVVNNPDFRSLIEIIFGQTAYRLTKKFHEDNPDAVNKISKGHANDFSTVLMKRFSNLFFDDKPNDGHKYIQVYGLINGYRSCKWFRSDWVTHPAPLDKFKVLVPKANGCGALGEVLVTPLVGSPLVGNTETFITVGAFDTEAEAEACIAYIRSKFCRVMLGILKVTQDNTPDKWAMVPMQDFNPATSDIDWKRQRRRATLSQIRLELRGD